MAQLKSEEWAEQQAAAVFDEFGVRSYSVCCSACQKDFNNCTDPFLTCHDALTACLKNCADSFGGTKEALTDEQIEKIVSRMVEIKKALKG
jgi:hypothetical protein